jgi:hypothetical protein
MGDKTTIHALAGERPVFPRRLWVCQVGLTMARSPIQEQRCAGARTATANRDGTFPWRVTRWMCQFDQLRASNYPVGDRVSSTSLADLPPAGVNTVS